MTDPMRGLLTRRLEEEGMSPDIPISVAELHRRLLPYPLCRDRIGYASKAEYDVDLLRLLADAGTVQVPETELREAVRVELESPEPGLALLQRFAASEILVARGGVETGPPIAALEPRLGRGDLIPGLDDPLLVPADEAADATGGAGAGLERDTPASGVGSEGQNEDTEVAPNGPVGSNRCRSCGVELPDRTGVRFCPRCGADQQSWPCPACGEVVERGWSYCALCGKLLPTS